VAVTPPAIQARQSAETNRPREITHSRQIAQTARQGLAESAAAPLPSDAHARKQEAPIARNRQITLPKTAGYVPLVASMGLLSLLLSTLLRLLLARLERS